MGHKQDCTVAAQEQTDDNARDKNQERSDRFQKEQEENVAAAVKDEQNAIDKQRNRNQAELQNKTDAHHDVIKRIETQIAETKTKTDVKVMKLKQQKEKLQSNSNNDRKEYHEKQMAVGKQHTLEIEKHVEETNELKLQREKDSVAHETNIDAIKLFSKKTEINVKIADSRDETERHFADSVSNVRRVALEVSTAVSGLETNATKLRDGYYAPLEVAVALKATRRTLANKMQNLKYAANGILEQQENRHHSVIECQRIARQIQTDITTLTSSVNDFMAILQYNPIAESRSLFKKVQVANKALQATVSSFPSISKTQHAVGVLVESMQSIQLRRDSIEQTETVAAIVIGEQVDNNANPQY